MKILIYGAGVIGSLFAVKLQAAGHEVTVLARGERLRDLIEHGLIAVEAGSGARLACPARAIERLAPGDRFDLTIVPVQRAQLAAILPVLQRHDGTGDVLVMSNNPSGLAELAQVLGRRVLAGFPGAGGGKEGHEIHYMLAPSILQPTTIGEIDGRLTPRVRRIAAILRRAGLPTAVTRKMEAWQKTHVAWISPLANALYGAGGSNYALAGDRRMLRLAIEGTREGFRVLARLGVPIVPFRLRFWQAVPLPVLAFVLGKIMRTKFAETVVARHANAAREEMRLLAEEFRLLAAKAGMATPALNQLQSYI